MRCVRPVGPAGAIDDRPEIAYSGEELERIEATILAEERTGASPNLWESVAEGDELGPLVKGPLSIMDVVAWCAGALGGPDDDNAEDSTSSARVAYWTRRRPGPSKWPGSRNCSPIGRATAHSCIASAVDVLSNPPLGSTTTITGEVVGRTISAEVALVHIAVEAVDQAGQTTARGRADIALASENWARSSCRFRVLDKPAFWWA